MRSDHAAPGRLRRAVSGPLPALPRAVDGLAEWWAGRPPRVRVAALTVALAAVVVGAEARVRVVERTWGGEPVAVLVASSPLGVGDAPSGLRRVRLPPRAVPPDAVTSVNDDARLAIGLPEGSVLTSAHLDPRGPAAGLGDGLRAVPLPVEEGWGLVAGGWVDVWVLGDTTTAGRLVARSRPVLEVSDEPRSSALVGLAEREVEQVTDGLGAGRLLLTHAPAPAAAGE